MMSRDLRWQEATLKWHHFTGSDLEVAVEGRKLAYTVHFASCKAVLEVGGSHVTGNTVMWPEVTRKWCHLTQSLLEVAVEGWKLAYTVHFTFYKSVARSGRQSRQEMTLRDQVTGSHLEVALKGWKLEYTVHFTSYRAVACSGRHSRDRNWCHVISGDWKWRHLTGIHLEVAVEGRTRIYCTFHFLQGCRSQ